jgi:hypothetical protein
MSAPTHDQFNIVMSPEALEAWAQRVTEVIDEQGLQSHDLINPLQILRSTALEYERVAPPTGDDNDH